MRRQGEILHHGTGGVSYADGPYHNIASLAARCRSSGLYPTGAALETSWGERRTHDDEGHTMFATFPSPWMMDQDRRCSDYHLAQAYRPFFTAAPDPATPQSSARGGVLGQPQDGDQ